MKPSRFPYADFLLGKSLPPQNWEKLFTAVFGGARNPSDIKALLLFLGKQGEGSPELTGCLAAVRRFEPARRVFLPFLVDVCGTGGDGTHTFNISTVSAFVIAAAGGYVAKHGNRAVSSRAGSSDLMESLGVRLDVPFPRMLHALRKCHFGYFHAPLYHSSFGRVQSTRRELGIRTIFNLLGPLVNPIEISYQAVGAAEESWLRPLAESLRAARRKKAAVFRSLDGLDELSTREANEILYVEGPKIRRFRLNPRRFGFSKARKSDYEGGDLKTNRRIARAILEDRLRDPHQEIVLLNSGFTLWLIGISSSIEEGIQKSRWVLRTGRAAGVLEALKRLTRAQG